MGRRAGGGDEGVTEVATDEEMLEFGASCTICRNVCHRSHMLDDESSISAVNDE